MSSARLKKPVERDALPAFLGADHPLAKAQEWRSALARQARVTAALTVIVATGLLKGVGIRPLLWAVAGAGFWVATAAAALRGRERKYAHLRPEARARSSRRRPTRTASALRARPPREAR